MSASHDGDQLFTQLFSRIYRFGRRWDEGVWRYHELSALSRLLLERPQLLDGPILDLGCGDGQVFAWIFGRRREAWGVDSGATRSDDVSRARLAGHYIEVLREDASRMSFPADKFKLVFSNSVLEHIAPVEPVLREVHRVLQPGGRFLFTTPHPRLYSREAYEWRRAFAPVGLDGVGRRMAQRENDAYHHVSIFDSATWIGKLESAQFEGAECQTYVPVPVARILTRFSGLMRYPRLQRAAWLLSREARALSAAASQDEAHWIESSRRILSSLLQPELSTNQCGQLLLAAKADTREPVMA